MKRQRPQSKRLFPRKVLLVLACVFLGSVGVLTALELTDTTHIFHKKAYNYPHTAGQSTKGEPLADKSDSTDEQADQPNTPTDDKGQSDTPLNPTTSLIDPKGNFVSAHNVSLASNPLVQSTCETTAKATCQIIFSKDNITKYLNPQTTDVGGAAYWTWKPQDMDGGLSVGSWRVQAKATLGGNTKTTDDVQNLVITQ